MSHSASSAPSADRAERARRLGVGEGLAFILGPFRGGTTLLRKILDSHSRIVSPAETWFLLPLLNLWDGEGSAPGYNPKQASAAIRGHVGVGEFLDCARAFAGRFYAARMSAGERWFVDKTPPYLAIAPALAAMFPKARFIALARDPRGLAWARHTWRHATSPDVRSRFGGVAQDLQRLASFARGEAARTIVVRYEELCLDAERVARGVCAFLGEAFEAGMIAYGNAAHHEGYGDENARLHERPHTSSIARWDDSFESSMQRELLALVGEGALRELGLGSIEALMSGTGLRRSA